MLDNRRCYVYVSVCSEDISSLAQLLPPKKAVIKYIQVNTTEIRRRGILNKNHTHLLVARPKHTSARVSHIVCVCDHYMVFLISLPG